MVWAAAFTFLAAFFSPAHQRPKTMGKGMMQLEDVGRYVGSAGLFGSIVRDVIDLAVGTADILIACLDWPLR